MRLITLFVLVFFALSTHALATTGPDGNAIPPDRRFDAFIGDRPLGTHRYDFFQDGDALALRSEAQFEFKLGFITLFSYDHVAEERWENGCLQRFESETEQNDDRFSVQGAWADGILALTTQDGADTVEEPCAWTFPYWDRTITTRSELINIQDGKRAEVRFSAPEPAEIEIGGARRTVEALTLKGGEEGKIDITLYYDGPLWLGLDSRLENGRTLRYRPSRGDPAFGQAPALGSSQ
jgi:hypothetical protein